MHRQAVHGTCKGARACKDTPRTVSEDCGGSRECALRLTLLSLKCSGARFFEGEVGCSIGFCFLMVCLRSSSCKRGHGSNEEKGSKKDLETCRRRGSLSHPQ